MCAQSHICREKLSCVCLQDEKLRSKLDWQTDDNSWIAGVICGNLKNSKHDKNGKNDKCAGGLGSHFLFNAYRSVVEGGSVSTHFAASRTVFIPKS